MFRIVWSSGRPQVWIAGILSGVVWLCTVAGFGQPNNPKCIQVSGFYDEQAVTSGCTSAVGLCTTYRYQGNLVADNFFTAETIVPTADTQATEVVFATGESILTNVHVAGRRGTLTIKNAAVFHTTGGGELLDVQTIVAGTGDLTGATGVIRTVGNFVNGAGRSVFDGFVCLP
jgi:hypothetical protein